MFASCVIDIFHGAALEGRHFAPTAETGFDLANEVLRRDAGLRADIYWVRAEDRSAAIAGTFSARSAAFSLPTNRVKESASTFHFENPLAAKRVKFALTVLQDARQVEEHLGRDRVVTVYNNSAYWEEFSDIPDEDFEWANAEIRARETGLPPVPHPHPEIGFIVWMTYKANLMDGHKDGQGRG